MSSTLSKTYDMLNYYKNSNIEHNRYLHQYMRLNFSYYITTSYLYLFAYKEDMKALLMSCHKIHKFLCIPQTLMLRWLFECLRKKLRLHYHQVLLSTSLDLLCGKSNC